MASNVRSILSPQHQFFRLCEEGTPKQLQENMKKFKEKKVDFNLGTDGNYKTLERHFPMHSTGLHLACHSGNLDVVKYLVEVLKVDVNKANFYGVLPLHKAASGKPIRITATVQEPRNKTVAKYVSMIKLLLANGAVVNQPDNEGSVPLRWSSIMGFAEGAQVLLDSGADPMMANNEKQTSLHAAARYGNKDVLENILTLSKSPLDIEIKDGDFKTPLHLAVIHGKQACVSVLMKHGADPSVPDNDPSDPTQVGTTALGYSKGDIRKLMKQLIAKPSKGDTKPSKRQHFFKEQTDSSTIQKVKEELDENIEDDNEETNNAKTDMKQFDYFISYCHANKILVDKIESEMKKKNPNLIIWRDIYQTSGGQALGGEIVQGIINSKVFLAMFSTEYLQSGPCMRENSLADAHKKRMVPVMLDQETCGNWIADLPPDLQYFYSSNLVKYLVAVDKDGKLIPKVADEILSTKL